MTTPTVAEEILNAWFSTDVEETEKANIEMLKVMDREAVRPSA